MTKKTKRKKQLMELVDVNKSYSLQDAISTLKNCPSVKFDESVEISLRLGVDPKKSDQQVRGTVTLPHGTGKEIKVLVFAKGEKVKEALSAGADFAGDEELVEKVKSGWIDFDAVIATPDMMREVGRLGKVLGPRGLMPTPKAGSVTNEVGKAVKDFKGGKVEFKLDKQANINGMVGKKSFNNEQIMENAKVFVHAIIKAKPSNSKGNFIRSFYLSTTMGPGLLIEASSV